MDIVSLIIASTSLTIAILTHIRHSKCMKCIECDTRTPTTSPNKISFT